MSPVLQVRVPDIGDFGDVPVIEVLVKPGDVIAEEDPLVTLESDKASMDVPSPLAGVVTELKVAVGDTVSEGSVILLLEAGADAVEEAAAAAEQPQVSAAAAAAPAAGAADVETELVVLGAGPGGYTAAFRAADLGKKVVLVERYPALGGVCLNVGCIPSKALLHMARVIAEADEAREGGISFGPPAIDVDRLRGWKESVVGRLTKGLAGLAKQRKVEVLEGVGAFESPGRMVVTGPDGKTTTVGFQHCIVAAGSSVTRLPGFPDDDPRLIDSTGALALDDVPERLLVIGGGIIGLEMACVYDALGSRVTVVELLDALIPGADGDLVAPLHKHVAQRYEAIHLETRVTKLEARPEGLLATLEGASAPEPQLFDRVLLAVGRRPNGREIGAEAAGVTVDERGFIPVDEQQRTNVPHIFAIGDVCGEPMLAHKATHEGKVAAEVVAGHDVSLDVRTIPSVAYTDPEVAWMGLTETEAEARGIAVEKAVFPWAASGRALSIGRSDGLTKILYDKDAHQVLGVGIVGVNAGELIAEATLALELGADVQDIALTVHPHPTLSETIAFAAEIADGTITDLYLPGKK
ncbi:MAG: dihydrolipoyl dehydrogenase [Gaiellaceae bacterium]